MWGREGVVWGVRVVRGRDVRLVRGREAASVRLAYQENLSTDHDSYLSANL